MNFIEELQWRGMLQDKTPGIKKELSKAKMVGYIGFDPTAPSLTIGNYVQIMILKLFQLSGHQPIVLMGGATGRIGDPSGKDKERELKSYEELDANLERQASQFYKFLDFDQGDHRAIMVNNLDFYKNLSTLDFLRDVGKHLTVNYMMSKESVKKRIETGISYTEFSYQLLQAYDFNCLYQSHNCRLQMGGSDQWGNITSGTELVRRMSGGKAYAITTPLLTKADGSKFGKSEQGNLWLSPELTSAYQFYQFWLKADDRDLSKFIRYFTLKSHQEVEAMEQEYMDNPNQLKKLLAEELTIRVHSREDYESVMKVSELLFNKKAGKDMLISLDTKSLYTISEEIPSFKVPRQMLADGVNVVDLLSEFTQVLHSKGEARRAIQGNAISINKDKITTHETAIDHQALLQGKYIMVENGKKNKYMIIAE